MAKYIDRDQLIDWLKTEIKFKDLSDGLGICLVMMKEDFERAIKHMPDSIIKDVEPVKHGRWELTTNSFYRDTFDESCELCVYIVANCSECSGKHPNSYQVFSKTLYAPDDADDDFRFDKKAEEEKALLEFRNKKYEFAYYCPNCGAKMDGVIDE